MASYQPLRTTEGSDDGLSEKPMLPPRGVSKLSVTILVLVTAAICSGVGYAIGHSTSRPLTLLEPAGDIISPLIYNKTFSLAPTPESKKAWLDIFPRGVGFVKDPVVSPQLSGLAVFHEIHCVQMLWVAYYAALDGTLASMQEIEDENRRPDSHHVRHCFDYLRQSLMCNADTNLEPVDFELGGVSGWKFNRKCRDFNAIRDWADEHRSWDPALPVGGH